jgi:hypothetical protein
MNIALVYAIGGTGAKCAEALVNLAATGIIEGDLEFRLIDQDDSNGNGTCVCELLERYRQVRDALRERGNLPDQSPIFAPRIAGGDKILPVLPNTDATLRGAYGIAREARLENDPDALLMHGLFTQEEREDRMVKGFVGRPAIGAAAFLCPQSRNHTELWEILDDDLGRVQKEHVVSHVLFMGSMFGGTGAAGLPTLARHFRNEASRTATKLGAVLCLRYFDVSGQSRYRPAEPAQMRAALSFYHQEMASGLGEPLLDSLYLVGLHPEIIVPAEPNGGGRGQANPPLLPEIIAALGAAHFFADTERTRSRPVWLCGQADRTVFGWDDLPVAGLKRQKRDPRDLLIDFARFCVAYRYAAHCAHKLSDLRNLRDLPMFYRFLNIDALEQGQYDEQGSQLALFCRQYLEWLGSCQFFTPNNGLLKLQLFDPDALAKLVVRHDPEDGTPVKAKLVQEPVDVGSGDSAAIDRVKRGYIALQRKGSRRGLDGLGPDMLRLSGGDDRSLGRFADALYRRARVGGVVQRT